MNAGAPDARHRWLPAFLESLAAERGAARNTLLAYGRDLKDYLDWLSGRGRDAAGAGRTDIEDYLVACDAQGLSPASRARRLSAVKQFHGFLHDEGWRADNPALRLKGPGARRSLPETLAPAEVEALIAAARSPGPDTAEGRRNLALVELLYATGLRVSELVGLPLAAARGDPRMILVRGKGDKERLVPLSRPARAALAGWLAERDIAEAARQKAGKPLSRFLFPGPGAEGHLTRQNVHGLLKTLARRAGLDPGRVTPHRLRHAFATHLLAGGADLRSIQTLLGHADLTTTEIYTHVLDAHLKALVLTHHPLAKARPKA